MISIKIKDGTPLSGKPLCQTCKHATVTLGQNKEERIVCGSDVFNATRGLVTFRVAQCGSYHPSNMPWLHEMEQMAWKIEARRRGPVGFSEPADGEMEVVITRPRSSNLPNQCPDVTAE